MTNWKAVAMTDVILDASAILALIFEEPGCDQVEAKLPGSAVSTVNMSEVAARLFALGTPEDTVETAIESLQLSIQPFDLDQALVAASLRSITRAAGLSLGDRACLALAKVQQAQALTADRAWADVADATGVNVVLIR